MTAVRLSKGGDGGLDFHGTTAGDEERARGRVSLVRISSASNVRVHQSAIADDAGGSSRARKHGEGAGSKEEQKSVMRSISVTEYLRTYRLTSTAQFAMIVVLVIVADIVV